VPVLSERADKLLAIRVSLDQQGFGIGPGTTAVLLDVPVMGADILEEPLALGRIGNETAERNIRIVMDENFSDVENDMINGH
jgi:hypothetical protein